MNKLKIIIIILLAGLIIAGWGNRINSMVKETGSYNNYIENAQYYVEINCIRKQ